MNQKHFWALPALVLIALTGNSIGGYWTWLGAGMYLFAGLVVDCLVPARPSRSAENDEQINQFWLHLSAVLITLLLVQFLLILRIWAYAEPDAGPLPISLTSGVPGPLSVAGATVTLGVYLGAVVGNVGHEYMHQHQSKLYSRMSRMMLAACQYSSLTLDHVYNHHRNVGTPKDPATARRGEGFWRFLVRCQAGSMRGAFDVERRRLGKLQGRASVLQNRAAQGLALQAGFLGLAFWTAGITGLLAYMAAALIGVIIIDAMNYIAHYGLVRAPGTRVAMRHSWSCARPVSSAFTFNITHHGEHHVNGSKPYWELSTGPNAPCYNWGPSVMIAFAFVPWIWFPLMEPKLREWDQRFATETERNLAQTQSAPREIGNPQAI